MSGETCPDTPCELCGDRTPGQARYEDHDRGWDALCAACWQLQQPPEPRPLEHAGLGRTRRGRAPHGSEHPERAEEAW